jgi:hypothetical protein
MIGHTTITGSDQKDALGAIIIGYGGAEVSSEYPAVILPAAEQPSPKQTTKKREQHGLGPQLLHIGRTGGFEARERGQRVPSTTQHLIIGLTDQSLVSVTDQHRVFIHPSITSTHTQKTV